ncbi:DNA polymerase IV [Eggerthella sp. NSJ-70]|uniref:DNA polymerase IV n=1 Tax=Eggerthella hominis TaxID=2763043 RepID=A0ABR7BWE7_9ACTN|nr:DNA polymerase IV [Eggerthella hominis]MBC5585435.1 DNA polymerase IV [Eggerthella hominis]
MQAASERGAKGEGGERGVPETFGGRTIGSPEGVDEHRVIFHSDMNAFYASVEQAERPELRGVPLVVGGHEELRHGIVLAKSAGAKAAGVKTGEALWEARAKCPGLVVVPPRYEVYQAYSAMARRIYYQYTDLVEPFGLDEAWLDLTGSLGLAGGDAAQAAAEISGRMKDELGCTVSIGVSWNKIFAKFGSDYRKPDAVTFVTPENYRRLVWDAPVSELLYVGAATRAKLHSSGIDCIGDLACASPELLRRRLGKIGLVLRAFARGEDATPVKPYDAARNEVDRTVKSFGNGLTAPHDIVNASDAKALIYLLSESVAQRLREARFRASTVSIGVRSAQDLTSYSRQTTLRRATNVTGTVARTAWDLLAANEPLDESRPLRGLHVCASNLEPCAAPQQLELPFDAHRRVLEDLDETIDGLRRRFGNTCIQRGAELLDESLLDLDVKKENVVHPVGYF